MAMAAIGDVLVEEGDPPGAYKMYQEEASAIDHEIGSKDSVDASSLTEIGQVLPATGQSG